MNTLLVAGATGIVGRGVIKHVHNLQDWSLISLSRSYPGADWPCPHRSIDLSDPESCRKSAAQLADVTHVVYAALREQPAVVDGWIEAEQVEANLQMLRNLIETLEAQAPGFRHITVIHGTKAYGVHLGPTKVPVKETDPRHMPPNFYFDQEDYLAEAQRGKDWAWTILRPSIVCGFAPRSPMNALATLGVFATISRELGLPLRFPGGAPCIQEAVDVDILARAIVWAGTTADCRNEIFNISNGDCFVWANLWDRVADVFDMERGPPHPISLARVMADKAPVWDGIVARHELQPFKLHELVASWQFADFLFRHGPHTSPLVVSTIKARKYGFTACEDTEEMFIRRLKELQDDRVLPS